jgi:hypothetical protein
MRDRRPVDCEAEDRVRPALGAGDGVVLGRDPDDLAERRLVRPRLRQHDRVAADRLHRVVVEMIMRDEQHVGFDSLDGRVVPLPVVPAHGTGDVAERVDEDPMLLPGEQERGLAVPADEHSSFLLSVETVVEATAPPRAGSAALRDPARR